MTLALRQLFARWSHEASYPAFSWICILILPVVLNLLIALVEDFRNSLGEYYGIFTLFMMFQLLLGFCCLFLSTMLVTSVGRSELIDQLRLTFTRPREMINALLGQLMLMIVPPALLFMLAVFGWIMFTTGAEDFQRMISFGRALLFLMLLLLSQLASILMIFLGLGRNVFWYVLVSLLGNFLFMAGSIYLLITEAIPWWMLPLLSLGFVVALYAFATYNLSRQWPPQKAGRTQVR